MPVQASQKKKQRLLMTNKTNDSKVVALIPHPPPSTIQSTMGNLGTLAPNFAVVGLSECSLTHLGGGRIFR